MDKDLDPRMSLESHRKRRRARTGRDAGELHALDRQLVDKRRRKSLSYIHTIFTEP
jgi:hypothetical protein